MFNGITQVCTPADTHSPERTTRASTAIYCIVQPVFCATAHRAGMRVSFHGQRSAGRVLIAPACTPSGMRSQSDPQIPTRPVPAPSLARMQLLQPLLCCSTKSEMILVTDRVPAAASAVTNSLPRGRRRAKRRPETFLAIV